MRAPPSPPPPPRPHLTSDRPLTDLSPPQTYYGEPDQHGDLGLLYAKGEPITARPLANQSSPWTSSPSPASRSLTVQRLLAPLAPHDVPSIRGMGLQYSADPAKPQQKPDVAVVFFKAANSLAGPGDAIVLPELAKGEKNDYEVELCVVLGKDAKDVQEQDAMSYVGGCVPRPARARAMPPTDTLDAPSLQLLRW